MSDILKDCKVVQFYIDDVIISGKTKAEHDANLPNALQKILDAGVRLHQKCLFSVTELNFLRHCVPAAGISPLSRKVNSIIRAASPTSAIQLK